MASYQLDQPAADLEQSPDTTGKSAYESNMKLNIDEPARLEMPRAQNPSHSLVSETPSDVDFYASPPSNAPSKLNTNLKFVLAVLLCIGISLGANLVTHSIDMSSMQSDAEAIHIQNQEQIELLRKELDLKFPPVNFTDYSKIDTVHHEQKLMAEIHAELTKQQKASQHQIEIDMINVFNATPNYTAAITVQKWKALGPFPLQNLINFDLIEVDWRHKEHFTLANNKQYQGQHNNFDAKNKHGLGRTEYLGGDMYEGQYVNGLKSGYGRYIWNSGDYYVGQFRMGTLEGKGLYVFASGTRRVGKFTKGVYVGQKTTN